MSEEAEWVVYSYTYGDGHHRVNRCTRRMWMDEWNKPDRGRSLELAQVTALAEGLTRVQAEKMVELAGEE